MNKFWERVFYFCTWFFMGSSFLVPRAYAVMHRMHHSYSDTGEDPHSPHFFEDVFTMMKKTGKIYGAFVRREVFPKPEFSANLPEWEFIDKLGDAKITRFLFGVSYSLFYIYIIFVLKAASPFFLLLLPIHYLIGPVQGAAVNWCGHKYGYRNYNTPDKSRNSEPFGFLLLGELFQNNHHQYPTSAKFSKKWFEIDFAFPVIKLFSWVGILKDVSK